MVPRFPQGNVFGGRFHFLVDVIYTSVHITPVLCDVLHWLPVPQRIQFKIAALTSDCVRSTGPEYSSSIACTVADNSGHPGLCSAERGDLFIPRTRTTRLGRRSFFIAAAVVWNSLPLHLRSPSISRSQFRAGLKTHLFRLAFHWLFLWELWKKLNWTELTLDRSDPTCRNIGISDTLHSSYCISCHVLLLLKYYIWTGCILLLNFVCSDARQRDICSDTPRRTFGLLWGRRCAAKLGDVAGSRRRGVQYSITTLQPLSQFTTTPNVHINKQFMFRLRTLVIEEIDFHKWWQWWWWWW